MRLMGRHSHVLSAYLTFERFDPGAKHFDVGRGRIERDRAPKLVDCLARFALIGECAGEGEVRLAIARLKCDDRAELFRGVRWVAEPRIAGTGEEVGAGEPRVLAERVARELQGVSGLSLPCQ